jgi:acetylornithine deacetylase
LKGDVLVAATVGEEDGGVGALTVVLSGYRADAALITEPTRLALVPAQGGSLVCRITVPGSAAHACVRDEGVSSFEKFLPIFADLMALERERNAAIDHPLYRHIANKIPINFGVVRAGNWASTVPESLVAESRIGLIAGEEVEPFREFIRDRIIAEANRDPWLRVHPPTIDRRRAVRPGRGTGRRANLPGGDRGARARNGLASGCGGRDLWRGYAPLQPDRRDAVRPVRRGGCEPRAPRR